MWAAALLLLLLVGTLTQRLLSRSESHPGSAALAVTITEILAILVPALCFLGPAARRHALLQDLRLTGSVPPSASPGTVSASLCALAGGLLFGVACFYLLSVWLEPLCEHLIPVSPEDKAQLMQLLHPASGLRPLWQDLLCFALVPALCEEILFRGALLSSLLRSLRGQKAASLGTQAKAVLLCALLFGIFHLSKSKLLPTTLLGVGFGAAALLSGSLWAAVAMHCTNNALVVLLVRAGLDEAPASSRVFFSRTAEDGQAPWPNVGLGHGLGQGALWLAVALLASAVGYTLLRCAHPAHPSSHHPSHNP